MQSAIFEDIWKSYSNNFDDGKKYKDFAEMYDYPSAEAIRSDFRRERKNRGLPSRNSIEIEPTIIENKQITYKIPKVLLFDIETSPILSYSWGLWNQNILPDAIIQDWFIISWSAKWLYSNKVESDIVTSEEILRSSDRRIVNSLWEKINEADILIGHNCKGFDIPRSNTRFLSCGLMPPKYSKVIDTLEIAKKNFGFSSNKLDYICGYLNLDGKRKTDFSLWLNCLEGNEESLKMMRKYNEQDVNILEDMYIVIRSWIRPHPNFGLWGEGTGKVCPNCGSDKLKEEGFYYTQVSKFLSYRCEDCHALSRAKQNQLSKEEKKVLLQ
jgi:hypothetical protein